MYTHRTNVLLDNELNDYLTWKSGREKVTVGEVIRRGLRLLQRQDSKQQIDYDLLERIRTAWQRVEQPKKMIDYKAWVNYGRK
jgi:hypothetical protein